MSDSRVACARTQARNVQDAPCHESTSLSSLLPFASDTGTTVVLSLSPSSFIQREGDSPSLSPLCFMRSAPLIPSQEAVICNRVSGRCCCAICCCCSCDPSVCVCCLQEKEGSATGDQTAFASDSRVSRLACTSERQSYTLTHIHIHFSSLPP